MIENRKEKKVFQAMIQKQLILKNQYQVLEQQKRKKKSLI